MNIIVCIKQVPNSTDVKINPETNTLMRDGVESIINPFDTYAIEEAVRLKEKFGGKVTVISMGPPQAEEAIKEAISLGCDEGILVTDRKFAGSDTWATSYTLAQAVKKVKEFDVILCGKQASDGDTAQVGPGISMHLDIPQATYVKRIDSISNGVIRIERQTEEGYEIIEGKLPIVLTVVKEINQPRLPSLKGKMKAKKYEVPRWSADFIDCMPNCIGLEGSPTRVVKVFSPPPRKGGIVLTGEPAEIAEKLACLLKDEIIS